MRPVVVASSSCFTEKVRSEWVDLKRQTSTCLVEISPLHFELTTCDKIRDLHVGDFFFFQAVFENMGKKFWETDPTIWDSINNTGLRCVFFCLVMSDRPTESLSAKCLIISSRLITNVQALVNQYLTSSFAVSGSFLCQLWLFQKTW